jgi:hypothetical protein
MDQSHSDTHSGSESELAMSRIEREFSDEVFLLLTMNIVTIALDKIMSFSVMLHYVTTHCHA